MSTIESSPRPAGDVVSRPQSTDLSTVQSTPRPAQDVVIRSALVPGNWISRIEVLSAPGTLGPSRSQGGDRLMVIKNSAELAESQVY